MASSGAVTSSSGRAPPVSSSLVVQTTASGQENTSAFLLPTAFPGFDFQVPRHQMNNNFNNNVNSSGQDQQPINHEMQQQMIPSNTCSVKNETHVSHGKGVKQHHQRNQPHLQQQTATQHTLQTQLTGPIMTAIAFPGNPLQPPSNVTQQQVLQQTAAVAAHQQHHQQGHPGILPSTVASCSSQNYNSRSTATSSQWPCPACKIGFKSASELQAHLSAHTKVEKSVPCNSCGKLFANQERVRIHVRVAHGEKSCACDICGSGFSYRCKLLDHMRTHTGDKPFTCDVCGRSFSQKNHVRRHQMIHTGERPFACDICGRGFYRKDKLDRHKKIHTGSPGSSSAAKEKRIAAATTTQPHHQNLQQMHPQPQLPNSLQSVVSQNPATIQLIPIVAAPQFRHQLAATQWMTQQALAAAGNIAGLSIGMGSVGGGTSNVNPPSTSTSGSTSGNTNNNMNGPPSSPIINNQ